MSLSETERGRRKWCQANQRQCRNVSAVSQAGKWSLVRLIGEIFFFISPDLLVSTRRPGTEIQKSNLLHLVLNYHVMYMCQSLLP